MKKKSVALYMVNEMREFTHVISKSALTRHKKRFSMDAGSVNYLTARPISELEEDK